ncbi:MAG: S66 peptidase family protein [Candidatus Dojkabacteria bacterium]
MKTVKPTALKKGDTVGVIALSDYVSEKDLVKSTKIVESWGLKVKFGKNLFKRTTDFAAGTPEQRKEDLWDMLKDKEVKAIWFASGGYSILQVMNIANERLTDKLRLEKKWFIGYSDNDIFSHYLTTIGMIGIHGPNFSGLYSWDSKSIEWIKKILFGKSPSYLPSDEKWLKIHEGEARGNLIVSNLTCLVNTFGTKFDPLESIQGNVILAIEETYNFKSDIKRLLEVIMLHKHSRKIKGIVLGSFTKLIVDDYPNWSKKTSIESIAVDTILEHKNIPIAQVHSFGHAAGLFNKSKRNSLVSKERFLAMPNAIDAEFVVDEHYCSLKFIEPISS